MGQKVNPIGLRLGYIRGWDSNWFASKKDFSDKLMEDEKLRKYLEARMAKGGIARIVTERTIKRITLTIHTARPGVIIGKGGTEVDKIREELKKLDPNVDPVPTSKSVSFGAFNVSVPYDAREQSFIQQKAGQLTKEKLGMLFNDPIYLNETDDYVRKAYVQKNIASSRSEAEAFMLENDQEIANSIMIRAGELANSKAMKENNGQPLNLVPSTLIDQ
jgi:hypothetical protein